jgi:polar amino acid transport system substrate-binding protein
MPCRQNLPQVKVERADAWLLLARPDQDRQTHGLSNKMRMRFLAVFIVVFAAFALPAQAQQSGGPPIGQGQTVKKVGVRVIAPFIMAENETYRGFSVELWRSIERELGWQSEFIRKESVRDLIASVAAKDVDLGIAAISITSQREEVIDFSLPMFDSGLQIMIRASASGGTPIQNMWTFLTSPGFVELLLVLALLIFVPLPIIWILERPKGSQMIEANTKLGAFFKSLWWTTTTLIGQGTDTPMSFGGKVLAITWMFVGLVFVSYFTGNVTAALTVQRLETGIKSPSDLYGRKIVTVEGTTAAAFIDSLGLDSIKMKDVPSAFEAIERGTVEAMVYDAPILMHYANTRGQGRMQMAGPVFKPEAYGIAFPLDSPLKEEVNRALLRLKESGRYQEIYDRWFRQRDAN